MFTLRNRVALVTGGAGHLGREVCRALLAAGAKVATGSRNLDRNAQLCRDLDPEGDRTLALSLDVCDTASVEAAFVRTGACFGGPTILINCANRAQSGAAEDLDDAAFHSAFAVNVEGYHRCCRAAFKFMSSHGGGAIVNFGSILGLAYPTAAAGPRAAGTPSINYATAKGAVATMSRCLAVEWGRFGIRVNCITPGAFPRNPGPHTAVPLQRCGHASEVASAALFLVSDAASYITGHDLVVDGGWSATL